MSALNTSNPQHRHQTLAIERAVNNQHKDRLVCLISRSGSDPWILMEINPGGNEYKGPVHSNLKCFTFEHISVTRFEHSGTPKGHLMQGSMEPRVDRLNNYECNISSNFIRCIDPWIYWLLDPSAHMAAVCADRSQDRWKHGSMDSFTEHCGIFRHVDPSSIGSIEQTPRHHDDQLIPMLFSHSRPIFLCWACALD